VTAARSRIPLTALAAALVAAAGCGSAGASSAPEMEGAHPSAEALVEAALEAVARGDRAALESLLVTRDEHHDLLWPALPESEHLSFEYARWLNEHNTGKAIERALERFGGEEFRLRRIEYMKGTETYPGFSLHRGAKLVVQHLSDGAEGELTLVDVLVERPEGWKLLDYEE
jgi:hypothetical protein